MHGVGLCRCSCTLRRIFLTSEPKEWSYYLNSQLDKTQEPREKGPSLHGDGCAEGAAWRRALIQWGAGQRGAPVRAGASCALSATQQRMNESRHALACAPLSLCAEFRIVLP